MSDLARVVAPLRALPQLRTLALLLLITFGWFVDPPAWNQNSRLALTRALVEHQTTAIDAYHFTTGDKSFRDGHFYSDKAPGLSALAVVPYLGFWAVRRASGRALPGVDVIPLDPLDRATGRAPAPDALEPGDRLRYDQAHRIALYVCRLLTSSLLSVLGLAAFYLLALPGLGRVRPALAVTLVYGLATPAFVYATAFYGHQPCAALLLIAFALVVLLPAHTGRLAPILVGGALGLAVCVEYPAALPAVAIAGFAGWRRGLGFVGWTVAGGVPFAAALALYHTLAFGHPFSTGYDHVFLPRFAEGMAVHYGLGAPDPGALLALTFGSYRGLFYVAPVLLLAAWGLWVGLVEPRRDRAEPAGPTLGRADFALALAIVAYYLLLNAGYYMWDGGAALGPRHCVPMLPFLALGLVPAVARVPRAVFVLAGISAVTMLAATAAGPEAPQFGDPIWGFAIPRLFEDVDTGTTDIGRLLGLPGGLGLLPLIAIWAWLWPLRRHPR